MVFSTIKFYGVPAGHRVHRDSPEKEVSTRCCEPSHAITTTLSWLSVPFYLTYTLPPTCRTTGWHHNSCICPFTAYFIVFVAFFSPTRLVLWNGDRRVAQNMEDSFCAGNLQARRHKTKMERVISFFWRGGRGGGSVGLQCTRTTFSSNVDLEHPLPITSQNAGPRQRVLPLLRP